MNHLGIFLLLVVVAATAHAYRYADRSVADGNGASDKSVRSPAIRKTAVIKRYARELRSPVDTDKIVRSPADTDKIVRSPAEPKTKRMIRYARELRSAADKAGE